MSRSRCWRTWRAPGKLGTARVQSAQFLEDFKAFVAAQGKPVTDAEWKDSEGYMRCALAREAMTMLEGQGAGFKAMIPVDLQFLKAESVLQDETVAKKAA